MLKKAPGLFSCSTTVLAGFILPLFILLIKKEEEEKTKHKTKQTL